MDNLIGQRFSLISKSEIRYVGTLHEINPEQSTIALEDVFSFGTEDRQVASFIPPSTQKFEYIVFRGSDVKDIKIEEEQEENKPQPTAPDDPAILNSSRPGPAQPSQGPAPGPPSARGESPFPPPPNFPPQGYGGYYGPPPGQFGRGYGPPPPGSFGPGPGYHPYGPPPPGYYGPPGQNFPPQGPGRFPPQPQQHPPPIGPPGQRAPLGQPPQPPPQSQQQPAPAPGLPLPAQATTPAVKPTPELPVEKAAEKSASKPTTPAPSAPPAASTEPPNLASTSAPATHPAQPSQPTKQPPTQPKVQRMTPAMPFAVNQKSFVPPVSADTSQSAAQQSTKPAKTQAEMDEASRKAKQAVENALANLSSQTAPPAQVAQPAPPSVENITERVGQMTTGPPSRGQRGGYRGQRPTRTSSGGHRPAPQKMDIPQSDFDFESANAKFNKEDLIKEAIASGSPISEDPPSALDSAVNGTPARKDSYPANSVPAYNKSSSFFDNISSEAKDREESKDVNGRALRGAEFKKNFETFGQGTVDGGYRGRGRGGYRGQRRGYGGNREGNGGYRGGYRGRGRGDAVDTPV